MHWTQPPHSPPISQSPPSLPQTSSSTTSNNTTGTSSFAAQAIQQSFFSSSSSSSTQPLSMTNYSSSTSAASSTASASATPQKRHSSTFVSAYPPLPPPPPSGAAGNSFAPPFGSSNTTFPSSIPPSPFPKPTPPSGSNVSGQPHYYQSSLPLQPQPSVSQQANSSYYGGYSNASAQPATFTPFTQPPQFQSHIAQSPRIDALPAATGSPLQPHSTLAAPAPSFYTQPRYDQQALDFTSVLSNPATQLTMKALESGTSSVTKGIYSFINMQKLRYYFNVDNSYVIRKVLLVIFPFRHKIWYRSQNSEGSPGLRFNPPRLDINSPDLYIPLMAIVTYIVVVGVQMGVKENFKPEILGATATTAGLFAFLEFALVWVGCNLLNIPNADYLDILAYSGYKYVGILITMLATIAFGKYGMAAAVYCAISLFYFILRSLRFILLPEAITSDKGFQQVPRRQPRIQFLFIVALVHVIFAFIQLRY